MLKDKNMFVLIISIFILVLFITGGVFADQKMADLIGITPFIEMRNSTAEPAPVNNLSVDNPVFAESAAFVLPDQGR